LPERLRHFRSQQSTEQPTAAPPLALNFPVNGTTVELPEHEGRLAELPLIATGGMRPLHWLINGQPLPAEAWRREAFWSPDGAGLVRISVLDQTGQAASAAVWISRSGE
jgi:penicillin-binding protein 1C